MTVSSDRHMLSGGVHAPVSVWRGVLQRQFTFSHLGGQKGGKSGCWDMIAALRRRKDRFDAQRVLRETMDQLSCLQIRAHVFVWKWDVWRGLSSILANLEQDDGIITVTLWMIYAHRQPFLCCLDTIHTSSGCSFMTWDSLAALALT